MKILLHFVKKLLSSFSFEFSFIMKGLLLLISLSLISIANCGNNIKVVALAINSLLNIIHYGNRTESVEKLVNEILQFKNGSKVFSCH